MGADTSSENESDLESLYLTAARVDGFRNRVYSIGPFGRRVSFASQQKRALNTVWALEHAQIIGPAKRIAVIGGGLAGVMTASALLVRNCAVYLYERDSRVLSLQQQTTHRYLHPTINFWPELTFYPGMELFPTTRFPFFDWHADQCSQVIDRLHEEWKAYFRDRLARVYRNSTAKKLIPSEDGITVEAEGEAPKEKKFDLVILAAGFGSEGQVAGIESKRYWDFDDQAAEEGAGPTPLVSGIGDGGLIEALRAVHRHFKRGRFCAEVARLMGTTHLRHMIKDLEETVVKDAGEDANRAAELYAAGYQTVFAESPPIVTEMLDASLRRDLFGPDPIPPVLLIGRRKYPYSLVAAPIHKFMITHAVQRGAVTYSVGELEDGPSLKLDGRAAALPSRPIVVRHGPDTTFGGLVEPKDVQSLKHRQRHLSDILRAAPHQADPNYWNGIPEYPQHDPDDPEFATFRYRDASRYINDEFSQPLTLANRDGVARYLVAEDLSRPQLKKWVPSRLFGVATQVENCRPMHVN